MRGKPQNELTKGAASKTTGTLISFLPDTEIFLDIEYDFATLAERMRETAFLTRGLRITLTDERGEGQTEEFYAEGGHRRLRRPPERGQGPAPQEVHLLRGRGRGGRGRDRDAVEHRLPGVDLLVRQQHQHARGRLAPVGLPLGADPDDERLRAREGPAQGEGPEPLRRRRPRGPDRGHLGEAPGPAVRGADEDEARQPADRGLRPGHRQPQARRVPRGEPGRRAADRA